MEVFVLSELSFGLLVQVERTFADLPLGFLTMETPLLPFVLQIHARGLYRRAF